MPFSNHQAPSLSLRESLAPLEAIPLPRLAERAEDLPLLCDVLLKRIPGAEQIEITDDAVAALKNYAFPGNIRELRNILERAALLADDGRITINELPEDVSANQILSVSGVEGTADRPVMTLAELERQYLIELKQRFSGDNRKLAQQLGVSERTLYRKLSQLTS